MPAANAYKTARNLRHKRAVLPPGKKRHQPRRKANQRNRGPRISGVVGGLFITPTKPAHHTGDNWLRPATWRDNPEEMAGWRQHRVC
jgi:hypothetical protein